jgi:hypothetical protein
MSETIERAVKAIAKAYDVDEGDERWKLWKDQFREAARAAIEAMCKPTKEMTEGLFDDKIWRAMIDAAKK